MHKRTHTEVDDKTVLLSGIKKNLLRRINPIYNLRFDKLGRAKEYFNDKRLLKSPSKRREISSYDVTK